MKIVKFQEVVYLLSVGHPNLFLQYPYSHCVADQSKAVRIDSVAWQRKSPGCLTWLTACVPCRPDHGYPAYLVTTTSCQRGCPGSGVRLAYWQS